MVHFNVRFVQFKLNIQISTNRTNHQLDLYDQTKSFLSTWTLSITFRYNMVAIFFKVAMFRIYKKVFIYKLNLKFVSKKLNNITLLLSDDVICIYLNQAKATDRRNLEFGWLCGSSKLLNRRKSVDPAKIRDLSDFEGSPGNDVTTIISSAAPNLVSIFLKWSSLNNKITILLK